MVSVNDINDLIFGVLARYGSVSLPSVGALRSVRVPASFTPEGTVEPPLRIVEFSNEIGDDKSVPELIAERDGSTVSAATERYDEWLALVSKRIPEGVRYTIEGVGTINLFAEGSAIFSMDPGLRTLLNPYGLSDEDIDIPSIKGRKHKGDSKERKNRRSRTSDRSGAASDSSSRYGLTVAMAVLTAVVCVLLLSSVFFAPEGIRITDRIDFDAIKEFFDVICRGIADMFSGVGRTSR